MILSGPGVLFAQRRFIACSILLSVIVIRHFIDTEYTYSWKFNKSATGGGGKKISLAW